MEQILNFRPVAADVVNNEGRKIKNIYRSADPSNASHEDINQLVELGIKNIIDLRSSAEISNLIDHPEIKIANIDIIGNGEQNQVDKYEVHELAEIMINLYQREFIATDGFTAELEHIISLEGQPFLFHCTAGKDRTGITAAILMHLLGFSYQDIKREYLQIDEQLVNAMMTKVLEHYKEVDDVHFDSVRAVASVSEDFLEAYLLGITDEYGTIDKYLESKLKVTDKYVAKLKDYYLE